jgi:cell division septation protein DedD
MVAYAINIVSSALPKKRGIPDGSGGKIGSACARVKGKVGAPATAPDPSESRHKIDPSRAVWYGTSWPEEQAPVREIETIDETPSRAARALQIAVGAAILLACAVFAAGVLVGKSGKASADDADGDPLARLDQALAAEEPETATAETPLTFHRSLVDPEAPTVSPSELAALGTQTATAPQGQGTTPPPAPVPVSSTTSADGSERIQHVGRGGEAEPPRPPSAPALPAPVTPAASPPAPEGADGPFTLQVASFQDEQEARRVSASLRGQSFRTFIVAADVAGRGMWFRVRIGPYRTQGEVDRARRDYEERTRQPAIVVKREDPSESASHGRNRR